MNADIHLARIDTSGDLIADKRFAYAGSLFEAGEHLAAADLFAQSAEQAPGWAPAYLARGLALEQAGDVAGACEALAAAAARDPSGSLGAPLHLARLQGDMSQGMPPAYVAALFDQYAPKFDAHLRDSLNYKGPEIIATALQRTGVNLTGAQVLDLGCGTGLAGRVLAPGVAALDGIDLSSGMLRRAQALGIYRHLWEGDCVAVATRLPPASYALIVAADVLVYFGDLSPLLLECRRLVESGGLFAATVQSGTDKSFSLGRDLRFQHGADYLRLALDEARFTPSVLEPCTTRSEKGRDVPGLVFVARRS